MNTQRVPRVAFQCCQQLSFRAFGVLSATIILGIQCVSSPGMPSMPVVSRRPRAAFYPKTTKIMWLSTTVPAIVLTPRFLRVFSKLRISNRGQKKLLKIEANLGELLSNYRNFFLPPRKKSRQFVRVFPILRKSRVFFLPRGRASIRGAINACNRR